MTKQTKDTLLQSLVSAVVILGTGAVILSSQIPFIRRVSEYSVHIMLSLFVFSMFALLLRQRKIMFASLACVGALCIFLKDASNTTLKLPKQNEEPHVNVAHINLSNISTNIINVIDALALDSIEMVSFQELTPDWNSILNELLVEKFPFSKSEVRIDPYGMAIYSKHPFVSTHIFDCKGKPNIQITVEKNDQSFEIYSSYLTPALDKNSIASASEELEIIADRISNSKRPVIALGEYNMVYWTKEIKAFRTKAKLTNSRRDLSQGNLRVPYDHIFFSEGLECTKFQEVRASDQSYVGIMGTYQIKGKQKAPTLNRQLSIQENKGQHG